MRSIGIWGMLVVCREVRNMSDERQYAFFRIAGAMMEGRELEKMKEAIDGMGVAQVKNMIEEAAAQGESRVMITDLGYIDFDAEEIRGLQGSANDE